MRVLLRLSLNWLPKLKGLPMANSFLSFFQHLNTDVKKGITVAQPFVQYAGLIPGFGTAFTTIFNTVATLEGLIPTSGQGTVKKATAMAAVNAQVPGLNQTHLSASIDQLVAALNAIAALEPAPGAQTTPSAAPSLPASS
jgi:hypothetical protein